MTRPVLLVVLIVTTTLYGVATLESGVVALAIPLAAYLAVGFARQPKDPKLRMERTLSKYHVAHDAPTHVTLRVTNDGDPLESILIDDSQSSGLRIMQGDARSLGPLDTGETVELNYEAAGNRGEFVFGPTSLVVGDPFDVVSKEYQMHAPAGVRVEPERQSVRQSNVRPARTRGFNGPIPARIGGTGTDFFNLREYAPGDRLRWINWRVTQRMSTRSETFRAPVPSSVTGGAEARSQPDGIGGLYTNVFEQQRIVDIGLIVDARSSVDFSRHGKSYFECSVVAANALCESFLKSGHRVGLLIFGAGVDSVFPGYGSVQRQRIVAALAGAKTGDHYIFNNLSNLPTRFFRPGSQIVFVGPCGQPDVAMLVRLRSLGYAVMAVTPDPTDFEIQAESTVSGAAGESTGRNLAERIARLEREQTLQELRRSGVQVVNWDPRRTLDVVMQESLRSARIPPVVRTAV